ncbi:hypothetical protein GOV13_05355 [Candidatus Pacearchaeota archaeon]|nr:hypothetical protein [Candidatus Pacearchaeota archaeon]
MRCKSKSKISTYPIRLNKRGSHVGVILSLLIFLGFILFLYVALEPVITTDEGEQVLLDTLKITLMEKVSENLTAVTIFINESYTSGEGCIEIAHLAETAGLNSIVKDQDGTIINSNSTQNDLRIEWEDKRFFKVYYSNESFNSYPAGEVTCVSPEEDTEYSIGLVREDKQIFETKIIELKNTYESDYSTLRRELNVPGDNDFGFDFEYANGTIIEAGSASSQSNIYIEGVPIQYIDREGNISSGEIKIKVW